MVGSIQRLRAKTSQQYHVILLQEFAKQILK
jgi:hypothetical protein